MLIILDWATWVSGISFEQPAPSARMVVQPGLSVNPLTRRPPLALLISCLLVVAARQPISSFQHGSHERHFPPNLKVSLLGATLLKLVLSVSAVDYADLDLYYREDVPGCKSKITHLLQFVYKANWRQRHAVAHEKALAEVVAKSRRGAGSCLYNLSDEEYISLLAGDLFKHWRLELSGNEFHDYFVQTIYLFAEGELKYDLGDDDPDKELNDIEQFLSWFATILETVINQSYPNLNKDGNLINRYNFCPYVCLCQ